MSNELKNKAAPSGNIAFPVYTSIQTLYNSGTMLNSCPF